MSNTKHTQRVAEHKGRGQHFPQRNYNSLQRNVCNLFEMYATSHKRPFAPAVGGIALLYLKGESPVSFVKYVQ